MDVIFVVFGMVNLETPMVEEEEDYEFMALFALVIVLQIYFPLHSTPHKISSALNSTKKGSTIKRSCA
ncbi:hypothetical protein ACLOJK_018888 [Asimina triloba]